MRPISLDEFLKIDLEILTSVDKFCRENGIKYSLAYGSLIGAIRHKGFIPWDDDIDILMLRDDYDRFMSSYTDARFAAVSRTNTPGYPSIIGKVYDTRSLVKEASRIKVSYGVYIDVFPVDDIYEDTTRAVKLLKKERMLYKIYLLKTVKLHYNWSKNISVFAARLLLAPIPLKCVLKKLDGYCSECREMATTKVTFQSPASWKSYKTYDRSLFANVIDVPFEGHYFMAIKEYDSYLRAIYGDYMTLPPEDKRKPHHTLNAFWKE